MAGMEKLFWLGLAPVGVRLIGGVVIWQKCVGLMNEFVNN